MGPSSDATREKIYRYGDRSKTARVVRSILLIGNFIFCILGCAVIAVGIYLIIDQIQFTSWVLGTDILPAACYLIIAAGCIMFLISFLGCFGTIFQNRSILLVYCVTLSLIFIIAMMAGVLAIVYSTWVLNVVRIYMLESLIITYGYTMENSWNNLVTRSWDEAQEKWHCCGVDDQGWSIYRKTHWYQDLPGDTDVDKPFVPATCCIRDDRGEYVSQQYCQYSANGPPARKDGVRNNYIYYKGCFNAGKQVLLKISTYFIVIGFVLSFIVIGGVICSLLLHRHL